jgi:cephalosporin-C deacetylase-like acetyl esterase
MAASLATALVPLSNFGSSGPAPVGSHQALGPYGTYDMQGNVKEWAFNRGPSGGWLLGGGWSDQDYFYAHALAASLFDRSAATGFRLMKETEPGKTARDLWELVNLKTQRDVTTIKPASNEVFEVYRRFFSYSSGELNATTPKVVQTTDDWTKELVTINTGYRNERMDVYLYIPRRGRGPFQPVIYFPGYGVFQIQRPSNSYDPANPGYPLDYMIKANRVLVQPVYQGTYERWNGVVDVTDEMNYPRKMVDWRWDIGRTLDYLQTRDDIDASRIGYVGTSFGGSYALPLLAMESRIKAAVLMSGGLTTQESVPPIADCINYAPRITIPVLMINGKFDNFFGAKTSQEPLFALLGTPPKDKRYEALEFGHAIPPRDRLIQETLGWLDKYLGPVQ